MTLVDSKRLLLTQTFLKYNEKLNLSAIRDSEGVYVKHILDSIELLKCFDFDDVNTIADVGTGGGFPLLPLALSLPNKQFIGIDSIRKKLQAIQDMCVDLSIENCTFIRTRLEECSTQFDCITARAVAHVEKLFPWVDKMLKEGSKLVLYKQLKMENKQIESEEKSEKEMMMNLLPKYNLKLITEHQYSLYTGDIQRVIYILQKVGI